MYKTTAQKRDRTVSDIDNEIKQLTQKTIQWEK